MNARLHLLVATTLAVAAAAVTAAEPGDVRDRISPEALRQRQAQAASPFGSATAEARDPRAKSPAARSIVRESTILSDGTCWTMVPVGSVLHVPEKLRDRVPEGPSGTLLTWQQFLGRNRGWVGTEEVDMETATGRKPVTEEMSANWQRRGSVVVAVHRGGAISVRRPTPEKKS